MKKYIYFLLSCLSLSALTACAIMDKNNNSNAAIAADEQSQAELLVTDEASLEPEALEEDSGIDEQKIDDLIAAIQSAKETIADDVTDSELIGQELVVEEESPEAEVLGEETIQDDQDDDSTQDSDIQEEDIQETLTI